MSNSRKDAEQSSCPSQLSHIQEKLLSESIAQFLNHPAVPQEWKDAIQSNKNLAGLTSSHQEVKSCKE